MCVAGGKPIHIPERGKAINEFAAFRVRNRVLRKGDV